MNAAWPVPTACVYVCVRARKPVTRRLVRGVGHGGGGESSGNVRYEIFYAATTPVARVRP